ncbi:MAG: hypothetical protein JWN04_704 [Myxococcaceae bacterium]|nr:hypothetical protein [Myxococcaceae bacterium]
MPECEIDPSEKNFPYSTATFAAISALAPIILRWSKRLQVPGIAVAGSIADELNTRAGARAYLDWLQDYVVISSLPSFAIETDYRLGSSSKWLNATRHDLGKGNINLATAREIYERTPEFFPKSMQSWSELVAYLLTDEGTTLVAALVIKKAMAEMKDYLKGRTPEIQEAILVTYYKQGPRYIDRFRARLAQGRTATLVPGEGCRVYNQRAQLVKALGSQ